MCVILTKTNCSVGIVLDINITFRGNDFKIIIEFYFLFLTYLFSCYRI